MRELKNKFSKIMIIISLLVFSLSLTALIFGEVLADTFDVIGIRIATLLVAFASFCSTSTFSYLVYFHNKTISKANDDANKRAELFRELQFSSSNYSIIEFKDSINIYKESDRYISKYYRKDNLRHHLVLKTINPEDFFTDPTKFRFLTLKIPFVVVEGKMVTKVIFEKIRFDRDNINYYFISPEHDNEAGAFVLYNEATKKNNVIINLVIPNESDFFIQNYINLFSKIKMHIKIVSLLGVEVRGITELYFTNPEEKTLDGTNVYQINSSNFELIEMPKIVKVSS